MKKLIGIVCVALCLCLGGLLTSCGGEKSNKSLLNEYKELCSDIVKAAKKGDVEKVQKLKIKGEALETEIGKRELTDKEKAEYLKIMHSAMSEYPEDGDWMMEDF